MSCGNESALWDIIQFLLDKIHHPLSTHLPLHQEASKIARSFRDLQNFILPTQDRAPCGDREGKPQTSLLKVKSIWKKRWEAAGLLPVAAVHNLMLVPSVLQTSPKNISAAQHHTSQAAPGERHRASSGLNPLCNSADRQHLWALWEGAGCLHPLPAPVLLEIPREFLVLVLLCGVLGRKRRAEGRKWQTSPVMLHHHQPNAARHFPKS